MEREEDSPIEIPITDVFDLHSIPPRDIRAAVEGYLEEAHRLGFRYVRIIHGKGIGAQRELVRSILGRTPFVNSFADAPLEAGSWGATVVTLGGAMQPAIALHEELANLSRQYARILDEAESLLPGLSRAQFVWQESPERWSIALNFSHLILVDRMYADRIEKAMAEGRENGKFANPPFLYSAIQSWFVKLIGPPARARFKAPKIFLPGPVSDPQETFAGFRTGNRRLGQAVEEANGLDLVRIKVASPAARWMKWSLGIMLAACAAHDMRHLEQARAVRQNPRFPER